MHYKGADDLRRVILAGLFIYPGYQAYLRRLARKQWEKTPLTESEACKFIEVERIECFKSEMHFSNISNPLQVAKYGVEQPNKKTNLETSGDLPNKTL